HLRALALAVRMGNRYEMVRALTGWGALLKDMGRIDEALEKYEEAARRASRAGQRRAAVVQHYIFALRVDSGQLEEAIPHAVKAFDLYPQRDDRVPALAHDLGYLLVRKRHFRLALHLLDAATTRPFRTRDLGIVFATVAHAAGGAGRLARYEAAEHLSLQLANTGGEYAAAALASLGEGARALGLWDRAEAHAPRPFASRAAAGTGADRAKRLLCYARS
ncbi:MAG TPA: hypothetical protein VFQ39_08560, partial [Longimicrobium sp.]|nr:hypothetical protein [Longimicrobium sp.]